LIGQYLRVLRVVVATVVIVLLSACGSVHPSARDLGVVHTIRGDAHAWCGGNYTDSCNDEAALDYEYCLANGRAVAQAFRPGNAQWDEALDQFVNVTLQAGAPPNGGHWTSFFCERALQ
jgi:hypothetical protein